jgi:hypothetical protein
MTILIGGKEGMSISFDGKHKLELFHNNFQTKKFSLKWRRAESIEVVIMDSLVPSLSYHTMEQL